MDSSSLFKQKNMGQLILCIIFIIYLLMGKSTPPQVISEFINTMGGKVIVIVISLIILVKYNPILGILGLLVAYSLIKNSSTVGGVYGLNKYLPTEKKKFNAMTEYNQFPYTLEQEVVKKMAPINRYESSISKTYSFNPVLDDLHDAAPIDYKGVV